MTSELTDDRRDVTEHPTGSRLDDWWAHVLRTGTRVAVWRWTGPLAVTLLAAVLRLVGLGHPHSLVFDETYYVKDGWSIVHLGYEGTWPANPSGDGAPTTDQRFADGQTGIFSSAAEFIAHPPLGKYLIGLGMLLFGADDSFGWRFTVAVLGIATVFLTAVIARSLFRSTLIGTLAGFLLAIDGQAIVLSRVTLLDGIVTFFVVLGFGALLLDRRWTERRLDAWIARRTAAGRDTLWGPFLWWRPWLIAMGLALGLATATKWSGMFFLAFFAVYSVLSDMMMRRRAGVEFWSSSAFLQQAPVSFLLTVPIAAATYLASWTGWFVSKDGWDRDWIGSEGGQRRTGPLAWVPDSLQNWWHYQSEIYGFNIGLHTPHSYQANPLLWLVMQRPTSMYYVGTDAGQAGCTASRCGEAITGIANPFIWYASVIAVVALLVLWLLRRRWEYGFVLLGVAAGYLPWLMYVNRTVFQFYTIAFEPFMVMALAAAIGLVLGRRTDERSRRTRAIVWVGVYLGVVVLASVYWYPMWTAIQMPWDFIRSHYWMPSWL
ncbi:dolichyl-phosphate-mannose--protein O-mannosyl transferase [Curtobacterium luteum]|uniref:Polyprenol-phosphate-mannose--protein mannosyltransferase n=1 Tax=Curtobacterium luteum TaxID=33881 RepID=A0A7Y6BA88_9MICO|nr:phospholipid carrier-dependent glycosyltransferase [Curtobacterium luteum]MBM7802553.1 dolichyl-phosphate-mannose--protein O-mannosyl transferase [Curtobacterium luteum]NUU50322.1 phospholipid carrier-dependent glycosyltransferase [Curtobacterium luteum]NUU50361.1 phospholipid carrier-dependent glycosyltransferase [Curtobacterium luteum]GGL06960.1 phospholipid carrier-dependent glycosyltransferase [Curtobacterium luteum]